MHGPLLETMPQQLFMPCGCDTTLLYFMYMPLRAHLKWRRTSD